MDFDAFSRLMHITVAPGTVFPNPGGGSSEIIDFSSGSLIYRRDNSRIYVSLRDLHITTKTQPAERLETSHSQVGRLLDPDNTAITPESLERLGRAAGKELKVELV